MATHYARAAKSVHALPASPPAAPPADAISCLGAFRTPVSRSAWLDRR